MIADSSATTENSSHDVRRGAASMLDNCETYGSSDVGDGSCNNSSRDVDDVEQDMLSVDQVSQMMREQDADLLERMHYASSQVSQYSPGGTPLLRPKDRALHLDEPPPMSIPLGESQTSDSGSAQPKHPDVLKASFFDSRKADSRSSDDRNSRQREDNESTVFSSILGCGSQPHHCGSESSDSKEVSRVFSRNLLQDSMHLEAQEECLLLTTLVAPTTNSRFRRLLSGEVRNVDGNPNNNNCEEEETTASPVSVAQETATTVLVQHKKKESGGAELRRVRDAIQFAEAVGEDIPINRDGLRIIEDNSDDGETDDDEEACKSKEIVLVDPVEIQESIPETGPDANTMSQGTLDADALSETQPVVQIDTLAPLPSHVAILSTPEFNRRKSKRPMWPFGPAGSDYDRFLDNLSDGLDQCDFVYKGICANPPEITKRGIQRGNYAQLHRKAWLEVSDKYHRYGKNLRLYYRYWERLGFPTNNFFDWLDSKGDSAGQPLPNIDECPRSVLDSDTVLYINNPEVTDGYSLDVMCGEDGRGRMIDVDGSPVLTGSDGWIFVLRDNVMYGAQKITSLSPFQAKVPSLIVLWGKAVAAAGIIITDEEGYLTRLYPHSGHYRPGEAHMQRMLFFLHRKGVDLRTFEMDTQQFRHVARDKEGSKNKDGPKKTNKKSKDGKDADKKVKKVDSLHMEKAVNVACFLAHKASFIGNGIFDKIHQIRKADAISVSEALELVDDGGFWNRLEEARDEDC